MRRLLLLAAAAATSSVAVSSALTVFSDPVIASDASSPARPAWPALKTLKTPVLQPVTEVQGMNAMCLDDTGNATVAHSKIQIWPCTGNAAQSWTFAGGELIHNGMCANDSGWGGNFSPVILWPCDGAANERWIHFGKDAYRLVANGAHLCLDDPAGSARAGTQLIVYQCNGGANQSWSSPVPESSTG